MPFLDYLLAFPFQSHGRKKKMGKAKFLSFLSLICTAIVIAIGLFKTFFSFFKSEPGESECSYAVNIWDPEKFINPAAYQRQTDFEMPNFKIK